MSEPPFTDLFSVPHLRKPLFISLAVMFGQQMSGRYAVLFFSVDIFDAAGVGVDAFVATVIVAAVQVAGTVLAAAVIDRVGRRPLLIASAFFMALSSFALGTHDNCSV